METVRDVYDDLVKRAADVRIRFTSAHLVVTIVYMLAICSEMTITWSSPVLPKLQSNDSNENPLDKPISGTELSRIGSYLNIGAFIAIWPFAYLSDRLGMKLVLLMLFVPYTASFLMLAYAHNVIVFYWARILGGVGVGAGLILLPIYVTEIVQDIDRGALISSLSLFWSIGYLIPYCIGPYTSIRTLNLVLVVFPILFFILFLIKGVESPYYLIKIGEEEKAEATLMWLRDTKHKENVDMEMKRIGTLLEERGTFVDLFKTRHNLQALFISLTLQLGQQLSGINAILYYTQEILEDAESDLPAEIAAIILGFIMVLSTIPAIVLSDMLGRKPLLSMSAFGMALSHLTTGIYYTLYERNVKVSSISWLAMLGLFTFVFFYNIGFGPIAWTVTAELFPTSVKTYAASIVTATSYMASFIVTRFFHSINSIISKDGTFYLFAACCMLSYVFVTFILIETKGKSVQEIQTELEGKT